MKTIIYLCLASSSLFIFQSCKSKKDATNNNDTVASAANEQPSTSANKQTAPTDVYRLVVSFISVGEGIDINKKEEFEKLLTSYNTKLSYEKINWGREGEVDYCLNLAELKENDKVDFVNKTKNLLTGSKLITISENKSCSHKQ